ncbi:hypothetical protein ABID30_002465 [Enterococcus rotai]|uniref:Uncharacterized protein n=1 Tax=Enterococcus rotai TaxID=118060 RepID=A0A0U2NNW1_9ENTE|nr:hypothetical protein [Enterococcus rotai]ALS36402.1 hypothetical protein ATZ35_04265 [Enterococcus rotai]
MENTSYEMCKELNLDELSKLSAVGGQDASAETYGAGGAIVISVTVILYTIGRTMTAAGLC